MNQAVHDLANGEPVTSSLNISRRPDIPEELIALAGKRMSRGERQPLEQQKADIEYKLKQIEEGDYTQQGLDRAAEQQALLDADNSGRVSTTGRRVPARKLADQRKANQEAATALGEEVRAEDAQPHQDSLARINELLAKDDQHREAHAEISRIEQRHLLDNGFIQHPEVKQRFEAALQEEVQNTERENASLDNHPTPESFVLSPNGTLNFGEITHEQAEKIGDFPGKIRLQHGIHNNDTGGGYGKVHIDRELRQDQLRSNGYQSTEELVHDVAKNHNAIYKGKGNSYILAKINGKAKIAFVLVKKGDDGYFYSIGSGLVTRGDYLKNKPLLWERAQTNQLEESPSAVTGQSNDLEQTIPQRQSDATKTDTPEITAAREALPSIPADKLFEVELEDGSIVIATADEHLAREDQDAAFAEQSELATDSAISCFLKFGDL